MSTPGSPGPGAEPVWPGDTAPLPAPLQQARSLWLPVRWAELPGFSQDALHEAWPAWVRGCERPAPGWAAACAELRRLSIASAEEQRAWMFARLQPYRIEPLPNAAAAATAPAAGAGGASAAGAALAGEGLLTGYYEPLFEATRLASSGFAAPLYRPPANLAQRKPWFTRQEIDTLPEARAALAGREIAWLSDPVDALVLQIQGSGRLRITEADGSQRLVRVAYAGTNDQPYKSVGRWLLDQGAIRDASWPGIKAWIAQNPQRVRELLWSNPRMVFFREEALPEFEAAFGPRGAQGIPLTPGRSIAVDPGSIPYGTPVWLVSQGPVVNLQKLVLAQDTGSAIIGVLRADYFTGWGAEAGDIAGRLKQPLKLWALWPK